MNCLLNVTGCTVKCGPWQIENFTDSQYYVVFVFVLAWKDYWLLTISLIHCTDWWIIYWTDHLIRLWICKFYFIDSQIWTIWVQVFVMLFVWKFNIVITSYLEICLCWDLCISIVHFIWESVWCIWNNCFNHLVIFVIRTPCDSK